MALRGVEESQVERALQEAAERVEPRLEEVAADIARLLHADVDELPGDPESREETRRACLATLRVFVGALRAGAPVERLAAPGENRAAARAMARTGASPTALARMCNLAHGASFGLWDEELEASGFPPEVVAAARQRAHELGFLWVDALSAQLSEEFERERRRWSRSPEAMRVEMVRGILEGGEVEIDEASRMLGYELRRHHVALVLWTRTRERGISVRPQLERAAVELAETLGGGRPLVLAAGTAITWVWTGAAAASELRALEPLGNGERADGISVAVGEPGHGLRGFRQSHRDAADAAHVALVGELPLGTVTGYRTVALAARFAKDVDGARRFVRDELGVLAIDDEERERLRATLKAYLEEDASRQTVARRLGVHPNTVANRVRTCQEALGRNLHERRVDLHVALELAEALRPAVLRSPQPPARA